jgi:glutamate dehydrogenase/leucine dehydrogenase
MGSTQGAIDAFEKTRASAKDAKDVCWYAPGKAANAGGVGELIISLPLSFVFRLSWRRLLIAFDRSLFPSHLSSAVSGLEMSQNSARIKWTREEVDSKYVGPLSISILRSSKEPLTDLRLLRLLSLSLSLSLSRLQDIMQNAYQNCFDTGARYPENPKEAAVLPSLVAGAYVSFPHLGLS